MTWSLSTAGAVVLSSTRSTKPVAVSGASTTSWVNGSTAYRMIRTRSAERWSSPRGRTAEPVGPCSLCTLRRRGRRRPRGPTACDGDVLACCSSKVGTWGRAGAGCSGLVQVATYPGTPPSDRDGAHGASGLTRRELGDDTPAEQAAVRVVQGARLSRGDRSHRLGEIDGDRPARNLPHAAGHGRGPVAALHQDPIARRPRLGEPVHFAERHGVAEQLVPGADHDLARLGSYRHHVHRLAESAGEPATLPDGIAREARVLPHHRAAGGPERPRSEGGRVGGQMTLEHAHVVIVGDEADLHGLHLVGGHEAEPAGDVPRLALAERPDGGEHPGDHGPVDAPEEV